VLNLKVPSVKQIELKAEPQEKDPADKASRFTASDDLFGTAGTFKGKVAGTIGSARYDGKFEITVKK
jgi:hypothetical protein